MVFFDYLKVIFIGIIEGITEWLPVSSTGHMMIFERFFPLETMSNSFYSMFLYVIQLAAILAVIVYFFSRLNPFSKKKSEAARKGTWRLWGLVLIGVIPAGVIGVALDDVIDEYVVNSSFGIYIVAAMLVLYGILYILLERKRKNTAPRIESIEDMSVRDALAIGLFQCLSIIPGTSRSGSTILGGMAFGVSRTASAEFSFFMAIPIMVGVSLLKVGKYALNAIGEVAGYAATLDELLMLAVGSAVSFAVSLICIRFLMDFVRRHSFEAFGWYRIAFGILVAVLALM